MNSNPRQSNSRIFWRVGGEACWYGIGGALIVAEDSLYEQFSIWFFSAFKLNCYIPCKIRTSRQNWLHLDCRSCHWLPGHAVSPTKVHSSQYAQFTYKTANIDIVGMRLAARGALDFESIPEVVLRSIIWRQFSHTVSRLVWSKTSKTSNLPRQVCCESERQHL